MSDPEICKGGVGGRGEVAVASYIIKFICEQIQKFVKRGGGGGGGGREDVV